MTTKQITSRPVRAAAFPTIQEADLAVRRLLAAGFSKDQLAVVCADKYKEQFFRDLKTLEPSGSHTAQGAAAGGAAGLALGGLLALITGNPILLAVGLIGPFVGAMMTRAFESEITDFYEDALQKGSILVAVEVQGENNGPRLVEAERILDEVGADPKPLTD